jgi:hypothetical protein
LLLLSLSLWLFWGGLLLFFFFSLWVQLTHTIYNIVGYKRGEQSVSFIISTKHFII